MDPHNQAYGIQVPAPLNPDQGPLVPNATPSYPFYPGNPPSIPNPQQHQELGYPQQPQSQAFAPPPPPPPPPPDEPAVSLPESTVYSGGYAQPPQGQAPSGLPGQSYWNEHGQWIGGYYGGQEPQQQTQHEQQPGQGPDQIAAQSQYFQDPHQQFQEYYHYQQYDTQYAGHQGNQFDLTQAQAPQQYYPPQTPGVDATSVPATPQTQLTDHTPPGQEEAPPTITQIPVDLSQMIIPQAMAQHYIVPHPHTPQSDLNGGGLGMIQPLVPSKPKSAVPEWLKQEMMKRGIKQPNSEEGATAEDGEKRDENVVREARRFTEEKARTGAIGGKSDSRKGGPGLDQTMEQSVEINKAVKAIALPLLLEVTETMFVDIAKEAIFESRKGQAARLAVPIIMEVADALLADIAMEVHRKAVAERSVLLASKETSNDSEGGKSSGEGPLGMDLLGLGYASDSSNSNAESPEVKGTLDSSQLVEADSGNTVDRTSGDEKGIPGAKRGPVGDADAPSSTGRGKDITSAEGKRRSENQEIGDDASTQCDVKEREAGSGAHSFAKPTVHSRATDVGEPLPASTRCKGHGDGPEKSGGKPNRSSRGRKDDRKKASRANAREQSRSPKDLEESKRGCSLSDKKKGSRSRSPSKKQRKRSLQRRSRSRSRDAKRRHNHHGATSKAQLRNTSDRHKATSPVNSIMSSASEDRGRRESKRRDRQRSRSSRRKKSSKERKSRH
ncbi:hypothetical protein BSKO_07749 [Bryopsis sp. KO-2023]|nr:hypothetical protein BSKO_07749 [Bryopsis sp. KO-2023]